MRTEMECIHCYVNQVTKISEFIELPKKKRQELMNKVLGYLSRLDYMKTNPEIMGEVLEVIKAETGVSDPYKALKVSFNHEIMAVYDDIKKHVQSRGNKILDYIKLAVYGNIIDYGIFHHVDNENWIEAVESALNDFNFQWNDTKDLLDKIANGKSLLYIGDNCGELVFDKMLIEQLRIRYPDLQITYCVRGNAVLNDNVLSDAYDVGMDDLVKLIDDGSKYPGFVYNTVSHEAKKVFDEADLVIAKGQGNYESLEDLETNKIYFLFMVKCDMLSKALQVDKNSKMCKRS